MSKWMTDCIDESPAVCLKMLKEKDKVIEKVKKLFLKKKYSKIVLVGSGSSYNIAMSAKYAMEEFLNIEVKVITPIAFVNYDYKYHEGAFIICMSQSGRSTNTIEAIQKAEECGYDVAGISMVPNSPLKNYCKNVLEYGSYTGELDSFVCRYFSSSVLYFILFALEAGKELGRVSEEVYKKKLEELTKVVEYLPTAVETVKEFHEKNKKSLYSMKRGMALGIGPTYGLTNEACLKLSETTGIPTNGYEIEEYLHGPAYEVKKDHGVFVMDADPLVHDRVISIYEASFQLTDRVYLITYSPSIKGENIVNFPVECDPVFRPLLYVIVFQYIPGKMCEDLNIRAVTIYNYRASQMVVTKTDK